VTEPSGELMKDLFAEFGLTYFVSEELCKGLGIFYTLMSFRSVDDITNPRIQEKFVKAESLTLGQVIEEVKTLVPIDLQNQLLEALNKRNYLAHQFWYERAFDMCLESGVIKLIDELCESRNLFEELDNQVSELVTERRKELGVTDEAIEDALQRGLAGEPEPPLPAKAPLRRKMIRIVQVYEIAGENKEVALVFQTDDGQFLQLCDVGLGWSNFAEVQSNWKINDALQQFLPASVVPRPEVTDPWNYEFKLPKHSVLWVKKGKSKKTFRWGIRNEKRN
jgi:hypothetical protein